MQLNASSEGEKLARLLRRIDLFSARIAPCRSRTAMSGAAATCAFFLDELGQPDEGGAALIKTVGLYPPGIIVRLAKSEIGIVFKRGFSPNEPLVAALIVMRGWPSFMSITIGSVIDARSRCAARQPPNPRPQAAARLTPQWNAAPGFKLIPRGTGPPLDKAVWCHVLCNT